MLPQSILTADTHMVTLSQAFNIHLLGLLFQGSLVFHDRQHNLAVKEDARANRYAVVEDVGVEDEAHAVHVLAQVVVAA